jgi:hypothetical protein
MLESGKGEVFVPRGRSEFQDNQTTAERRLRREIDPRVRPSPEFRNQVEIPELVSRDREPGRARTECSLTLHQSPNLCLPEWEPVVEFGKRGRLTVFLPQGELLGNQLEYRLRGVLEMGQPIQVGFGERSFPLTPVGDHVLRQSFNHRRL